MKRISKILMFFLNITVLSLQSAPSHVLTAFFQPYPTQQQTANSSSIDLQESPINSFNSPIHTGIFVSYYGYKAITDHNGQVLFPLKQTETSFTLLVCKDPIPVFNIGSTIHHWEVPQKSSFSFYQISQFVHEKTKKVLWNIQKKDLDKVWDSITKEYVESRAIPLATLIIHANPEGIYIPEGVSLIQNGEQTVLPTIYVKSAITSPENALSFLQTSDFFSPVHRVFKMD